MIEPSSRLTVRTGFPAHSPPTFYLRNVYNITRKGKTQMRRKKKLEKRGLSSPPEFLPAFLLFLGTTAATELEKRLKDAIVTR